MEQSEPHISELVQNNNIITIKLLCYFQNNDIIINTTVSLTKLMKNNNNFDIFHFTLASKI